MSGAYAGLVYEPDVPRVSLFWDLIGSHSNLVPVKVDGATRELSFFAGRGDGRGGQGVMS